MAVTTPPAVTPLPTPPSTASPSNFDSRADAFLGALPTYQTEQNALADNVYDNAVDAAASATAAATQAGNSASSAATAVANAQAAAASAGAIAWVSGTTYAIGDRRWSLTNGRVYKRLTVGAGTTDPSADATNWAIVDLSDVVVHVAGTTATATTGQWLSLNNVAATVVTANATPADNEEFAVRASNGLITNSVDFGAKVIQGPTGSLNIITLDTPYGWYRFKYSSTLNVWMFV